MSSVMLRAALQMARQEEWEAMTGALRSGESVVKGFVADVGDVDHDAEAIHFVDYVFAERR